MVDISPMAPLATSTPQDAADNIKNAGIFGVDPTAYKDQKENLSPVVQQLEKPTDAEPNVASYMQQSPEHAALASPDVPHLSYMERQLSLINDTVNDRATTDRQVIDLANKKMDDPDKFSPDDDLTLQVLNQQRATLAARDYGINGPYEKLPAEIIGGIADFGRSIKRNAGLIAGFTAAGTTIGAGVGSVVPVVGTIEGALQGAKYGLKAGFEASQYWDGYQSLRGSTYNELSNMQDGNGAPIAVDEQTKANIARGVGVIGGVAQAAVGLAAAKASPIFSKFVVPSLAKQIVLDPTNAALKTVVATIGKNAAIGLATGAGAGGITEMAKIIGEEMAKSNDSSPASFMNALTVASQKFEENSKRVAQAALTTGATAGVLVGGISALHARGNFKAALAAQEATIAGARDVTPEAPAQLQAPGASSETGSIPVEPNAPAPEGRNTAVIKALNSLRYQDAMDNVDAVKKSTNMAKVSPAELNSAQQTMYEGVGMGDVYLDKEDLSKFTNSDEKAAAVKEMLGVKGIADAAMNAPARVKAHDFAIMREKYPDISDIAKLEADAPNPNQAREFLQSLQDHEGRRATILDKLGAGEKDPAERAYAVKITPEMTDSEIAGKLGSKEVADAYLDRLDVNQTDVLSRLTKTVNGFEGAPEDMQNFQDIRTVRERVKAMREIAPTDETTKMVLKQALETPQPEPSYDGEEDYLNRPTFTDAIKNSLGKGEVERLNEAQSKAREHVAGAIEQAAQLEMDHVRSEVEENAIEAQYEQATHNLANDPNLAVVDQFISDKPFRVTASHAKKGFSPLAIDPSSLPPKLWKFENNLQLKKNKVFVRGGISVDESARLAGVNSAQNLLNILSQTPSRAEAIEKAVNAKRGEISQLAKDTVDLNKTAIAKAYSDNTQIHLNEMKLLKSKEWPAVRGGIKRIALPLPTVPELNAKAKTAVQQLKVSQLNSKQFAVGERRSQRLAVEAILKNDVEKAFVNKEAAALNSEFQKEVMIANGKVNRAFKFFKRLQRPDNMQTFEDAGKLYTDARDEILDVFKLDRSKSNQSKKGSYQQWLQKMVDEGKGNYEIPDSVSRELLDKRVTANDLSVQAITLLHARLQNLLRQAEMKNQLYGKFREQELVQNRDAIAQALTEIAKSNPFYDEKKAMKQPASLAVSPFKATGDYIYKTQLALTANIENLLLKMDNEIDGGLYAEAILYPIQGRGRFQGQGLQAYNRDTEVWKEHLAKGIEKFGAKEFVQLYREKVNVPEFADNPNLGNGVVPKATLVSMLAHMGTETNKAALENFGLSRDVLMTVLERELDHKHMEFAQEQFMDAEASLYDKANKNELEMSGTELGYQIPTPINFKGKQYPGGYTRIYRDVDMSFAKGADNAVKSVEGSPTDMKTNNFLRFANQSTTAQGYTQERVDSKLPLDLSLDNIGRAIAEKLYDIHMRKPLRDSLSLLAHPEVRQSIASVIGRDGYKMVVGYVNSAARPSENQSAAYWKSATNVLTKTMGHIMSGWSVGTLTGRVASYVIHTATTPIMLERAGYTSVGPYAADVFRMMGMNPDKNKEFYELAVQINPQIREELEHVSSTMVQGLDKLLPSKTHIPVLTPANNAKKFASEIGFAPYSWIDAQQKVGWTLALYKQARAGEARDLGKDIFNLPEEEQHNRAMNYASSAVNQIFRSGTPLDKTPFQRVADFGFANMFFNIGRNILGQTFSVTRRLRRSASAVNSALGEGGTSFGGGGGDGGESGGGPEWTTEEMPRRGQSEKADINTAFKNGKDFASVLAVATMTAALYKVMEDVIRGRPNPLADQKWKTPDDIKKGAQAAYDYFMEPEILSDRFTEFFPFLKDMLHAAKQEHRGTDKKEVSFPMMQVFNDFATDIGALHDYVTAGKHWGGFSDEQKKAMVMSSSYILHVPFTGSYYKYVDGNLPSQTAVKGELQSLRDKINGMIGNTGKSDQAQLPPEFLEQLKQADLDVNPAQSAQHVAVPEGTVDTIKKIESSGQWWKKNPNSTAAGLYQFTQDTWDNIKSQAPELGLTAAGRTAKDSAQQDKAMNYLTQQNAQKLNELGADVNVQNLYMAHFLGIDTAVKVLLSESTTKLKTLVPTEVMKANGFKNGMKVKDFQKWVDEKVKNAGSESTES